MLKFIPLLLLLAACTNQPRSTEILKANGFNDIRFIGWGNYECYQSSFYATRFTARDPAGRRVIGTVCDDFWNSNPSITTHER